MNSPFFQEAVSGQQYVEPDYDQIEREQDQVDDERDAPTRRLRNDSQYVPAQVSKDELFRIKEDMRHNRIDVNPDTLRHALEAEEIRKLLRTMGIRSLRSVAGTRDFRGVLRMSFVEFRSVVEQLRGEEVQMRAEIKRLRAELAEANAKLDNAS